VNSLQGVVAQTHASSPRCSAYLAAQLRELAAVLKAAAPAAPAIPELGKLVVFGAGDKYGNGFIYIGKTVGYNTFYKFGAILYLTYISLTIYP
jgi:hypothetical protein